MLSLPLPLVYSLLVVAGVGIGVAASFTGLGGGFLMVPLLLAVGMAVPQAVGTSFLAILIISVSALVAHAKLAHVDRWLGALLGLGGAAGAQGGARLLPLVPERDFRILFAMVLVGLAVRLLLYKRRARSNDEPGLRTGRRRPSSYVGFLLLGAAVGMAAAFTGLGGGFVVVPAAMVLGLSAAQAVGTSFLAILIIACSALTAHARLAHVDLGVGVALGAGGVVGAQLGSRLVDRVSQQTFRRLFSVLLITLAGHMLLG